jgi:transcriptional regulator of acetoin/glycerol metabolism
VQHILHKLAGAESDSLTPIVLKRLSASVSATYDWPGNVRELEQAIRRVLLTREYRPERGSGTVSESDALAGALSAGTLDADTLLARYCRLLHGRCGNIEEVARRTALDRRTVKRYLGLHTGADL